jgi:probable rRNA maturation factor
MQLSLSPSERNIEWLNEDLVAALSEACAALGGDELRVDVVLTDDAGIRRINRDFRGIDRETDVISFSYMEEDVHPVSEDTSGELYISTETIEKEAKKRKVEAGHLFLRTAVHGLLHVVGYDHQSDAEADEMEAEEKKLLSRWLDSGQVEKLFA